MKKNFILGFISGGIICATVTGLAVEYAITPNPYPVTVNGTNQQIEGYNINDSTYFKLRDIADVVGGFTVDFVNDTISLTSKTQTSNVDNVNSDDKFIEVNDMVLLDKNGLYYTNDEFKIPLVEIDLSVYHEIYPDKYPADAPIFYVVWIQRLNDILDDLGYGGIYKFTVETMINYEKIPMRLVNKQTGEVIFDNIPQKGIEDHTSIEYYFSTILPWIRNLPIIQ